MSLEDDLVREGYLDPHYKLIFLQSRSAFDALVLDRRTRQSKHARGRYRAKKAERLARLPWHDVADKLTGFMDGFFEDRRD